MVVDGSENGGNEMRIYRWFSPKGSSERLGCATLPSKSN